MKANAKTTGTPTRRVVFFHSSIWWRASCVAFLRHPCETVDTPQTDFNRDETTTLLLGVSSGDALSAEALLPIVYQQLRRMAHGQLRRQRSDHTLNTTGLVHEAYLKLINGERAGYESRAHFCAIAAKAMRSILIDYARRRSAQRRGGGRQQVRMEEHHLAVDEQVLSVLALDDALTHLSKHDERLEKVVEGRFLGGMTMEDIAAVQGVSVRTVERDWKRARAYLRVALADE